MKLKKRIIAPRLLSGERRVGFGHGLPPEIKEGIRRIAALENQSMSWVMEQVIIRYFKLPKPDYVERKYEVQSKARTVPSRTRNKNSPRIVDKGEKAKG